MTDMNSLATRSLALAIFVALGSCGGPDLVGKWRGGRYGLTYEFLSSGDYTVSGPGGSGSTHKYQVVDKGRVKFEESFGFSVLCNYNVGGDTLTVSGCDGYAGTYKKV